MVVGVVTMATWTRGARVPATGELEQEQPAVAMLPGDAADLGLSRRGVEPLRIVVMPQHNRQPITSPIEAMPVLV
jgi:hypothetical protein